VSNLGFTPFPENCRRIQSLQQQDKSDAKQQLLIAEVNPMTGTVQILRSFDWS